MKRHLAYNLEKVNLILVSDVRNEMSSPKFNLNAFGIYYEYNWSLPISQNIQMS